MTHDKAREKICALCFSENGHKAYRLITDFQEKTIQEYVHADFSRSDRHFPVGICPVCQTRLTRLRAGKISSITLSDCFNHTVVPPSTRANSCNCTICFRAALNGKDWMQFKAEIKQKEKTGSVGSFLGRRLCPDCLSEVKLYIFRGDLFECHRAVCWLERPVKVCLTCSRLLAGITMG